MSDRTTIGKPDDWRLHVRGGDMMPSSLAHGAEKFGRAVMMPNLVPPVTTTTNSSAGITDFNKITCVLERMEKIGLSGRHQWHNLS